MVCIGAATYIESSNSRRQIEVYNRNRDGSPTKFTFLLIIIIEWVTNS